ncbi:MAG: FAD-binding protein, partial [Clostridia bacterium]|nr:FAD-binding protein [Clostridia bacterium]
VFGRDIPPKYQSDGLGRQLGSAQALVFPLTTQEVSGLLRYAHANRIPVTPRGAGTNLVGSTIPQLGGIVLDLSRMNRILELDKATMTVTVQAGVLLEDLQAKVEEAGLFYPPDPGEKASTLGGNISTNAGGMRAVKYGVTRNYVRGLETVMADGAIVTMGGKNVKDASGLSLKDLIVGSEGTMAVITACTLKLLPKPETSISILVPFADLKTGIGSVLAVLQSGANPTAVEFIERKVAAMGEQYLGMAYPCPQAGSYLLLTFDGEAQEVAVQQEQARKLMLARGALDYVVLDDPAVAAAVWQVRGALVRAVEAVSEQEPLDIVIPIDRIAEFVTFINCLEKESGMQMIAFGHAGDGNVHLCMVRGARDEKTWKTELDENLKKIYAQAYQFGGLASGEHGIGLSKRPYYFAQTNHQTIQMMNRMKDALDPLHILNEGKSYLTGGEPDATFV